MSQKTIVINTKNKAVTEYTNYAFNSFCRFNGQDYGANDNGIIPLSGDDDNGADIDASAKTATADVGKGRPKKLRDVWIVGRKGPMTFTIVADETNSYTYNADIDDMNIHEERVKTGRGIRGRSFSFELANVAGSDFNIDSVRVKTRSIKKVR